MSALVLSSLLIVLATSIHRRILRPRHRVYLLVRQPSSIWTTGCDSDRSLPRSSFTRAHLLVLRHLPFKLHRIGKNAAMRPLLTLRILLVDLFQIDFMMFVLILGLLTPMTTIVMWIFHHRSRHKAVITRLELIDRIPSRLAALNVLLSRPSTIFILSAPLFVIHRPLVVVLQTVIHIIAFCRFALNIYWLVSNFFRINDFITIQIKY